MEIADIKVVYRHLPSDITDEFENIKNSDFSVIVKEDKKEYFHFSGGPADILIYFEQHPTELIVTGLIIPTIFEGFKYALSTTWKRLTKHSNKKQEKIQNDKNKIELNFKVGQDKTVEFSLRGTANEETIDNAIDKIFEYLRDKTKQENDFQNPDLKGNFDLKPKIRLQYNSQTDKWTPVNFAEIKKFKEELIQQPKKRFND